MMMMFSIQLNTHTYKYNLGVSVSDRIIIPNCDVNVKGNKNSFFQDTRNIFYGLTGGLATAAAFL